MKVYSAEEIVKKYSHELMELVRDRLWTKRDRYIDDIDTICTALGLGYDWKNSGEGFENWLPRMIEEGKISQVTGDYISELWNERSKIDEEWKAVYYGINQ